MSKQANENTLKESKEKTTLKIAGIEIENFRSFRKFPENHFLPIGKFTTIIGQNDVGKSNLIKAILVALGEHSIEAGDFYNPRNPQEPITIKLWFEFDNQAYNQDLRELLKEELDLNKPPNQMFCIGITKKLEDRNPQKIYCDQNNGTLGLKNKSYNYLKTTSSHTHYMSRHSTIPKTSSAQSRTP